MTKSFGRMLLGLSLLSCSSSSGGGGGGGLGDNAATNMTAAAARCSVAWNRCKGMALAQLGYPGATSEADCVAKIRADDAKEPQGDLPCPVGKMLDATAANNCLTQVNTAACTDIDKVVAACSPNLLCVTKTAGGSGGAGGGVGPGQGGTVGGGFGGTQGGLGGSTPPGQGGSTGGNACNMCVDSACQSQIAACNANPECVALYNCVTKCQDQTCEQACVNQHPGGVNALNAFGSCISSSCGTPCGTGGGMMPPGMGGMSGGGQGGASGGNACDTCLQTNCGPQLNACNSPSTPCGQVLQCAQNCMNNTACVNNCAASNPAGGL